MGEKDDATLEDPEKAVAKDEEKQKLLVPD